MRGAEIVPHAACDPDAGYMPAFSRKWNFFSSHLELTGLNRRGAKAESAYRVQCVLRATVTLPCAATALAREPMLTALRHRMLIPRANCRRRRRGSSFDMSTKRSPSGMQKREALSSTPDTSRDCVALSIEKIEPPTRGFSDFDELGFPRNQCVFDGPLRLADLGSVPLTVPLPTKHQRRVSLTRAPADFRSRARTGTCAAEDATS